MSPIKRKKLNKIRSKLDKLDNSLIKLIKQRTNLVDHVLKLKNKKETIRTGEGVVVDGNKNLCNLFKTKPEKSIKWIDEDGNEIVRPDDINAFLKRKKKKMAGKKE